MISTEIAKDTRNNPLAFQNSEIRKTHLMETNEIDVELLAAQEALARAQKRRADAEEAARLSAQAALAKNLADEQERLARIQREAEEAQRRGAEKRAAKEEAKRIEEAARAAETRRLETEYEARCQAAREEAARQERIRKVTEQARQMEIDAANLEVSLRQANTPREEQKPATLRDAVHPLSMIFAPDAVPTATIREISSEENAKLTAQREATPKSEVWRVVKHGPGNNFVNSGTSRLLEKEIKQQTGIQANTQRLDLLSSLYDEADLMTALGLAVAAFRESPMSHDGLLGFIESLLLEAENVTA